MNNEHIWLAFLSILFTLIALFLGLLYRVVSLWRKDIMTEIEKFCKRNDCEHTEIWERINYHRHTTEGEVIIPIGSK